MVHHIVLETFFEQLHKMRTCLLILVLTVSLCNGHCPVGPSDQIGVLRHQCAHALLELTSVIRCKDVPWSDQTMMCDIVDEEDEKAFSCKADSNCLAFEVIANIRAEQIVDVPRNSVRLQGPITQQCWNNLKSFELAVTMSPPCCFENLSLFKYKKRVI